MKNQKKLVTVSDLLIQFDTECLDVDLEKAVKDLLKRVNSNLAMTFREEAPQILNKNSKINISVEKIEDTYE